MKKIALLLSIILIASSTAFAQRERAPRGNKDRAPRYEQRDRGNFFDRLNLTDEQKEKMKQINADFAKERDAIEKSRISPDMQKEKLKALREKKQTDISSLLTDEQKKIWETKKDSPKRQTTSQSCMMMKQGYPMMKGECPTMEDKCPMMKNDSCCAQMPQMGKGKQRPSHRPGFAHNPKFNRQRPMAAIWKLNGIELDDKQKEELKKITEEHRASMTELNKKHQEERAKITEKQEDAIKKILTNEQKQKFEENQEKAKNRRPAPENKK